MPFPALSIMLVMIASIEFSPYSTLEDSRLLLAISNKLLNFMLYWFVSILFFMYFLYFFIEYGDVELIFL